MADLRHSLSGAPFAGEVLQMLEERNVPFVQQCTHSAQQVRNQLAAALLDYDVLYTCMT